MNLQIYSTLSRKKETFVPIETGKINMFVCGPTVYDFSHLGHAKTYVQFDTIVKYLRYLGFDVFYLQNITDIDNKIIRRANEQGILWKELSKKYGEEFMKDMESLKVNSITKYAKATDYIPEIISQVKRLIDKGYAYKISDGWYFDLSKDTDYGKLAHRTTLDNEDAVSRIDENEEKRNPGDFCLWKFSKAGEPLWETDLGNGRPGWHIEDTAITEKEFGPQYDIHGGGLDLIFPHHEAEIAQMESLSGKKPLVKIWMHTGFLSINKEKMSKSLGNFSTIKEVLKQHSPETLRYLFLSTHYRKPLEFSQNALENAKSSIVRLKNICGKLKDEDEINGEYMEKFEEAMNDDFNTPNALQVIWKLLRDDSAKGKYPTIKKMDSVLELNLLEKEDILVPEEIQNLLDERKKAREEKDWTKSDELRDKIKENGFIVKDTKEGQEIEKKD